MNVNYKRIIPVVVASMLAAIISLSDLPAWEQQIQVQSPNPVITQENPTDRQIPLWETTEIEPASAEDPFNRSSQIDSELGIDWTEYKAAVEAVIQAELAISSEAESIEREKLDSHQTTVVPKETPSVNQILQPADAEAEPEDEVTFAEAILSLVNQERQVHGLSSLILDNELEHCATIRVSELTVLASHDRPNGTPFYTSLESISYEFLLLSIKNPHFWRRKIPIVRILTPIFQLPT
jgi:hypothetical protein